LKIKRDFFRAAGAVFALMCVISASILFTASKYENLIVRKIEIEGLRNFDEDDVNEVMLTTVGYPLKSAEVREDIKQIFALGFFENVKFEIDEDGDGVKVRVIVEERPVVEKLLFRGYDELIETDLLESMQIKEGEVYRKDLVETCISC
jgi:outer membrane protein insertion porin family